MKVLSININNDISASTDLEGGSPSSIAIAIQRTLYTYKARYSCYALHANSREVWDHAPQEFLETTLSKIEQIWWIEIFSNVAIVICCIIMTFSIYILMHMYVHSSVAISINI